MDKKIFNIDDLERLGFEYVEDGCTETDGGETYYQLILDKSDPFHSPYLYTEKRNIGEYAIFDGKTHTQLDYIEITQLLKEYNEKI